MNLNDWLGIYPRICTDLNIDPRDDMDSALILSSILGENSDLHLLERFEGGTYYVVGNGPNLDSALRSIPHGRSIVADSALARYMEAFGAPDIVVTDLDGDIPILEDAFSNGSLMVIHAHGDNREKLLKHAWKFTRRAIGTTQTRPLKNVFNFYGFTDGDRAAYLAHYLKADKIILVGFDFKEVTVKEGSNAERKLKKLKWARFLLDLLAKERGTELVENSLIPL